ncbi:MAG: hypothetical protein RLZZ04_2599 [Cyanobacteriota bacterium]|jgi:hypothetical protein
MEQLIINALKSACGNKNIKFQIIIQDNQLHIYGNHRPEYQPNYSILETNVCGAIASLSLDNINGLWLYTRPLSQVEPNWQVFIELPTQDQDKIGDTESNLEQPELDILDLEAEFETEIDSVTDIEGIGNFDLMTSGTTGDARLMLNQVDTDKQDQTLLQEAIEVVDVVSFSQTSLGYSTGDTGLLQEQGLIHGRPLKEVEINTVIASTGDSTEVAVSPTHNKLAQYCFISNSELTPKQRVTPSKTVIRLVKFFHYLSAEDQQSIAPVIENYLRLGVIDPGAEILPASQNWLTKITALDTPEQSAFAWWLSCYCAEPAATLDEFKTISAQNAAEMNIKQVNRVATYGFVPVNDDVPDSSNLEPFIPLDQKLDEPLDQPKFQLPPKVKILVKKLLLPGIWTLGTMILIMIGIISQNSKLVKTSAPMPGVCNNTIGSVEYCRLAVNLAGERAIAQEPKNLFPLTDVTESVATYGCQRYANLKAGTAIAKIDPKTTPVISSQGSKIFPHIYVVTAEQKNANQLGTTKVGCVYATGQAQRSPKKLAADLIPLNWQQKQYPAQEQQQTEKRENLSFGSLTKPINLGLATIFGAVGIAIASWLNLGLKINHPHTVYLVALMLGMVQLGNTLFMPNNFWGLLGAILFPILTILTTSLFFRDFQFDWERGYSSIAITILAIVAIQFLFYSLSLGLITSLI